LQLQSSWVQHVCHQRVILKRSVHASKLYNNNSILFDEHVVNYSVSVLEVSCRSFTVGPSKQLPLRFFLLCIGPNPPCLFMSSMSRISSPNSFCMELHREHRTDMTVFWGYPANSACLMRSFRAFRLFFHRRKTVRLLLRSVYTMHFERFWAPPGVSVWQRPRRAVAAFNVSVDSIRLRVCFPPFNFFAMTRPFASPGIRFTRPVPHLHRGADDVCLHGRPEVP
jgi:hypothetical protein